MNIFDITAFMAPPDYNPVCLCGHPQSQHPYISPTSSALVKCMVKECTCWRFRLPEETTVNTADGSVIRFVDHGDGDLISDDLLWRTVKEQA